MKAKINQYGSLSILRGSEWREQECGDKTCNDGCPNFVDGPKGYESSNMIQINCGTEPILIVVVDDERK